MKKIAIVASIILTGCASGPAYKDSVATFPQLSSEDVRIIIFRTKESMTFIARNAPIELDGEEIGAAGYGGFLLHDTKKGSHTLRTELWDSPGECALPFTIDQTGREYFFEVKPREAANDAFQESSSFFFPVITGMSGMAAESSGKLCGGLFSIEAVSEKIAKSKLMVSPKANK